MCALLLHADHASGWGGAVRIINSSDVDETSGSDLAEALLNVEA